MNDSSRGRGGNAFFCSPSCRSPTLSAIDGSAFFLFFLVEQETIAQAVVQTGIFHSNETKRKNNNMRETRENRALFGRLAWQHKLTRLLGKVPGELH